MTATSIIPLERIHSAIYSVRELDSDLALLYQVNVKALNQAVRRNAERFPSDFMFQLTREEYEALRSHLVTLKRGRGQHRKYPPLVFTEQGIGMLSSVLRSPRAAMVNVEIMRTFVQLRKYALTNEELDRRIATLEKKYDVRFRTVFDAIRKLLEPENHKPTLGFARKKG